MNFFILFKTTTYEVIPGEPSGPTWFSAASIRAQCSASCGGCKCFHLLATYSARWRTHRLIPRVVLQVWHDGEAALAGAFQSTLTAVEQVCLWPKLMPGKQCSPFVLWRQSLRDWLARLCSLGWPSNSGAIYRPVCSPFEHRGRGVGNGRAQVAALRGVGCLLTQMREPKRDGQRLCHQADAQQLDDSVAVAYAPPQSIRKAVTPDRHLTLLKSKAALPLCRVSHSRRRLASVI
jgi:hypothetical protein